MTLLFTASIVFALRNVKVRHNSVSDKLEITTLAIHSLEDERSQLLSIKQLLMG